jgi:hypothetical protein
LKTIAITVEGDPNPAMRVGFKFQIVPVAGESGGVVAYRFVGEGGTTVMTVPATAVRVVEQHGEAATPKPERRSALAQVAESAGGEFDSGLTDEEEIELLRALGYDV